jgi:hypothetical protein
MSDIKNGLMPNHEGFGVGRVTTVVDGKHPTTLRLRKPFEELPDAVEVCNQLVAEVKSEQRVDYVVTEASELAMDSAGQLILYHNHPPTPIHYYWPTCFSLSQLSGRICSVDSKPYPYMGAIWPSLRADNINAHIKNFFETRKRKNKSITLRTRTRLSQGSELFAVVSKVYNRTVDIDTVVDRFSRELPSGCKADALYDGRALILTVVLDETIVTHKQKDLFRPSLVLTTADDATMGLSIRPGIWHSGSMGLLTYGEKELKLYGGRHTKALTLDGLNEAMNEPLDAVIELFHTNWEAALEQRVISSGPDGPEKMFTYLVDGKFIRIPSIKRSSLLSALVDANQLVEEDIRQTKAGVILSILEIPQIFPLTVMDEDLLFRQAGALLVKKFSKSKVEETT